MNSKFDYSDYAYRLNDISLRRMEFLFRLIERGRERNLLTEDEYDKSLMILIKDVEDGTKW